jgi:tetratricopeptide (TPR) repeat protein
MLPASGGAQRRLADVSAKAAGEPEALTAKEAGELEALAGKKAGELEALADALGAKSDWIGAIALYHKAIALQPANFQLYVKLGAALARDGNDGDKVAGSRIAVELYPKMPAAHFSLGQALVNTDRAGAVAAYRMAIQLDPKFNFAYLPLWAALTSTASKEDHEAAVAVASKFMEFNRALGLLLRGQACKNLDQSDKALADFDEAVTVDPQMWQAWQEKGKVHAETGQWDNAIAAYSRVLIANPGWWDGWPIRAQLYEKAGKWDQAVADYAEAIRLSPEILQWQTALAWLLTNCPNPLIRNPRRAVELARKGVSGEHRVEWAWNALGAAHYRAGDWKAAVEALEKSIELRHGGEALDWYFLAMAYQRLGKTDEARRWYDKAAERRYVKYELLQRVEAEAKELLEVTEE